MVTFGNRLHQLWARHCTDLRVTEYSSDALNPTKLLQFVSFIIGD